MAGSKKHRDYDSYPNYLKRLVKSVLEFHEVTEALKSKSYIKVGGGKGKKGSEAVKGIVLLRKMKVFDKANQVAVDCNKISGQIKFWLGYYNDV